MSNFRRIDRDTGFLVPPSGDEWLPKNRLVRFVVEVIAGLDLQAITGSYRGSGSASYPRWYCWTSRSMATRPTCFRAAARGAAEGRSVRVGGRSGEVDGPGRSRGSGRSFGRPVGSGELARREKRLSRLAEARAKIEARALNRSRTSNVRLPYGCRAQNMAEAHGR